jgi:stage II sporulation protein P
MNYKQDHDRKIQRRVFYKKSGLYFIAVICLFILIGFLTTVKPAYRVSSDIITEWTSDIGGEVFINLIGMENRLFLHSLTEETELPGLSSAFFQLATSIKPNDPRSLLGNEIPGFSIYDNQILIAGEGTDYTNLPVESSAPLEEVLEEREAVMEEDFDREDSSQEEGQTGPNTGGRKVVYLYNSHTRESYLPHLPDVEDPNLAHHSEVNVTKISERLASELEKEGIGSQVESEDIGKLLDDRGWEYWQSYDAAREVAQEAMGTNDDIEYLIDIHRDSLDKDATTKEINGEPYARLLFVVGEDHANYEKNLEIATELHYLIEEAYPGLSRGVFTKGGAGSDGVYNQDLTENALLVEFGGVENNFDELFRTADAFAEVFSEFYWSDAEEVSN